MFDVNARKCTEVNHLFDIKITFCVLCRASGHVDRFADFMVKDIVTGDCFRVDHLIEGHLEQLLEKKDLTDEKRAEIEKILSQVIVDEEE